MLYGVLVNAALAFEYRFYTVFPTSPAQRARYVDMATAIDRGGLGGWLGFLRRGPVYIAGGSLVRGNVFTDNYVERSDQTYASGEDQGSHLAAYRVEVSEAGDYELALRCLNSVPARVRLSSGGTETEAVCSAVSLREWSNAGKLRLQKGLIELELTGQGVFPHLSVIRLNRAQ
jgi:hypothetical protein